MSVAKNLVFIVGYDAYIVPFSGGCRHRTLHRDFYSAGVYSAAGTVAVTADGRSGTRVVPSHIYALTERSVSVVLAGIV